MNRTDANPFQPPAACSVSNSIVSSGFTVQRRIAAGFVLLPFLIAIPLRYWMMNHAGSWVVSTELEPDHRAAFLGLMFIGNMAAISVVSLFVASVLLFLSRWRRVLSSVSVVIFGLLLIPALWWIWIGIDSYIKYS